MRLIPFFERRVLIPASAIVIGENDLYSIQSIQDGLRTLFMAPNAKIFLLFGPI